MSVKTKIILLCLTLVIIRLSSHLFFYEREQAELQANLAAQDARLAQSLDQVVTLSAGELTALSVPSAQSGDPASLRALVDSGVVDAVWVFKPDHTLQSFISPSATDPFQSGGVISAEAFQAVFAKQSQGHFFAAAPSGDVYELSGVKLSPADPQAAGFVFLGRRWSADHLARLSTAAGGQLSLQPRSGAAPAGSTQTLRLINHDLTGWDGTPLPVTLQGRFTDLISDHMVRLHNQEVVANVAASILALGLLLGTLFAWVVFPLRQISNGLSSGSMGGIQKFMGARDEYGNIARLIQQFVEQKNRLDAEVAQRSAVEEALRSSEEAYRALVDHSIQGLAILAHGRVVFSNQSLAADLGYTADEMQSLNHEQVQRLIHPIDRTLVQQAVDDCLEREIPQHIEARMLHKDGSLRWMEVFANRIDYLGDRAIQITYMDITSRRVAEQALFQEQSFTLAILNTVNSLVVVLDSAGQVVRCNPASERLTGMGSDEMQGCFFWDIFNLPEEAEAVRETVLDMVQTGAETQLETRYHMPGGQRCWLAWSNAFLPAVDGSQMYIVCTGVDVTERLQRERQQKVVAALASDLRGNLSRRQTVRVILDLVLKFLKADRVALAIYYPASSQLVIEDSLGPGGLSTGALGGGESPLVGLRFSASEGAAAEALRTGRPCLVNQPGGSVGAIYPDLADTAYGAWAPLVAEGSSLGVLVVASQTPINTDDFLLLTAIADITASAVQRCILSEQTQRRLHRLMALHTINISVSANLAINVTLDVLVNQITTQLGVDAAAIYKLDPVTQNLTCLAGHGFRSVNLAELQLWLGQGQAGQVALSRRSLQLYDPAGIAAYFLPVQHFAGEDFIAYDAVPLLIKGEVRGVLETFHRAPYEPDPDWLGFVEALATETSIAINNAELLDKLQRNNLDLALAYDATIEGWAQALELRDEMTEDHTRRVADITVKLAQALGVRGDELKAMRYGALLHDIGKIAVPDAILRKPGALTAEEWAVMRQHPDFSLKMLASIPFLNSAIAIPYSHHERWDGSGYPQKLAGKDIPLAARIFAVVDVWDALRSVRPYHAAVPEEEVLAYIQQESGRQFDPEVVAAFVESYKHFNLS